MFSPPFSQIAGILIKGNFFSSVSIDFVSSEQQKQIQFDNVEKLKFLYMVGGNIKWCSCFENSLAIPEKVTRG